MYRDGLEIALKGLEPAQMKDLMKFLYKKSDSVNHQKIVLECLEVVLSVISASDNFLDDEIDKIMYMINLKFAEEESIIQNASELGSLVEVIESI